MIQSQGKDVPKLQSFLPCSECLLAFSLAYQGKDRYWGFFGVKGRVNKEPHRLCGSGFFRQRTETIARLSSTTSRVPARIMQRTRGDLNMSGAGIIWKFLQSHIWCLNEGDLTVGLSGAWDWSIYTGSSVWLGLLHDMAALELSDFFFYLMTRGLTGTCPSKQHRRLMAFFF